MSPLDLARQVLARGHEGTEAHTLARALVVAEGHRAELLAASRAVLPLVFRDDWCRGYERHGHRHDGVWDQTLNLCGECAAVERFKAAVDVEP